jgi:2,4-dienoyl-CoA reductase-like NADH-dependent reductase (Old Yellow Enzyme family)
MEPAAQFDDIFQPGRIGSVEIRNRVVRAGTSESMAAPGGEVTSELIKLYRSLADDLVGLILTGHMYCEERGRYAVGQTGIHRDESISSLRRLTQAVHDGGGKVFAQLAHAGSQSRVHGNVPLAPSPIPNPLTGLEVKGASEEEIEAAIAAFASGARRAVEAGFDGVHIHGANGYLISEFSSPVTNARRDSWGGSVEGRERFGLEIVNAIRASVPRGYPVSMKVGFEDASPGGLTADDSVQRTKRLVSAGLDAVEVSCNLMQAPTDSAMQYVAVRGYRAFLDLLPHRVLKAPEPEAYFLPLARKLRAAVDTKIVLVGGMRSPETMRSILRGGAADFVAMARPFIREPDLVRKIAAGRETPFECTSCNLCLMHEGHHSLRCWRVPRYRLLQHALYRFGGSFRRGRVIPVTRHH